MTEKPDSPELQPVLEGEPLARVIPATKADLLAVNAAAFSFQEQGQLGKARHAFSALIQLSPKLYVGYAGLGAVALTERKLEEALQLLSKAAELRPNDPTVYTNLGETMLRLGQAKEAAVLLQCAIENDPKGRNPAANRARAMLAAIEENAASASDSKS